MDDVVQRLRDIPRTSMLYSRRKMLDEAADEIERLRDLVGWCEVLAPRLVDAAKERIEQGEKRDRKTSDSEKGKE